MIKKIFPFSYLAKTVKGLVVSLLGYLIVGALFGLMFGLLNNIPILGIIFSIISSVIGLYLLAGMVVALLVYFKIVS